MAILRCLGQLSQLMQDLQIEFYCLAIRKRKTKEKQAHLSEESAPKPPLLGSFKNPRSVQIFPSVLFVCLIEK